MQRIVDGILYEAKQVPDAWEVSTWTASGVMERTIRPIYEWAELGPVPPLDEPDPERDGEWLEEKRQQCLRKAAQRAKRECRRAIIVGRFDELLTLTTRESYDAPTFKRYFKEWVRRMRASLGGRFDYVAGFEPQLRGAYHAHVACYRLPAHVERKGVRIPGWKLGTMLWRRIVGEGNGLVYVGGRSKTGLPRAQRFTLAKMAAYVSKYVMKDYEKLPPGSNRYSRSQGVAKIPPPEKIRLVNCSFAQAIDLAFECPAGSVVVSHRLSRWGDSVWLCTEKRIQNHRVSPDSNR